MGKHLNPTDRASIESNLNANVSLRQIAMRTGKAQSTISREIYNRRNPLSTDAYARVSNKCLNRLTCKKSGICPDRPDCVVRHCASCKFCNRVCPEFVEELCVRLSEPPYVCNGCPSIGKCTLSKFAYHASYADKQYRTLLHECRMGINFTEAQLLFIDQLLSPLIKNGQSIYHIVTTHKNSLICSPRTAYRLVHGNALSARNIDMPRVCRLKLRKGAHIQLKIDRACRLNRTYSDFKAFVSEHPELSVVEMDSVIGTLGGKVLLTLHVKSCDFMLAFLRDANTSQSVIDWINALESSLGLTCFRNLFAVLLADNGSEFSNPSTIEKDAEGQQRTHVFYCDPSAPYEKPNVELNHQFIRKFLPKGTSFDSLSQDDVNLMMSHINSYGRAKFNGQSPSQLLASCFGENVLRLVWQERISPEKIILNASIFKRK